MPHVLSLFLMLPVCPFFLFYLCLTTIVQTNQDKESFSNVERWIKDYKDNRGNEAPCVLVANKVDLKLSRPLFIAFPFQNKEIDYMYINSKRSEFR